MNKKSQLSCDLVRDDMANSPLSKLVVKVTTRDEMGKRPPTEVIARPLSPPPPTVLSGGEGLYILVGGAERGRRIGGIVEDTVRIYRRASQPDFAAYLGSRSKIGRGLFLFLFEKGGKISHPSWLLSSHIIGIRRERACHSGGQYWLPPFVACRSQFEGGKFFVTCMHGVTSQF